MKKSLLGLVVAALVSTPLYAAPQKNQPMPLDQRVDILERKLKALSKLVIELDSLQREMQQLRGEVEVQNHAMDALKKRQRDLYLDVDQRLNQLSRGTTPIVAEPQVAEPPMTEETPAVVEAPAAASSVGATPVQASASQTATPAPAMAAQPVDPVMEEKAYKAAFEMLMQRRYGDAKVAFQDFLTQYPGGSYGDNAQYWLAEASYVTRDFDTALVDFQKVITAYPSSTKVPDALLKSSFIHYEKKQWAEARQSLQTLVDQYPNSTASKLAAKRLQRMKSEGH